MPNPISAIRADIEQEHAKERETVCPRCGQRLPRNVRPGPRAKRIIEIVAFEFDLEASDLYGRDQHKRFSRARQVACYLLRTRLQRSYPEIGETMGLDNSTVLRGIKSVEKWMREAPEAAERMRAIEEVLNAMPSNVI